MARRGRPPGHSSSSNTLANSIRSSLTEEDEDGHFLKLVDEGSGSITRVSWQPNCIVGGKMRPYQVEGLNCLVQWHESGMNGILADEMGLGTQAI